MFWALGWVSSRRRSRLSSLRNSSPVLPSVSRGWLPLPLSNSSSAASNSTWHTPPFRQRTSAHKSVVVVELVAVVRVAVVVDDVPERVDEVLETVVAVVMELEVEEDVTVVSVVVVTVVVVTVVMVIDEAVTDETVVAVAVDTVVRVAVVVVVSVAVLVVAEVSVVELSEELDVGVAVEEVTVGVPEVVDDVTVEVEVEVSVRDVTEVSVVAVVVEAVVALVVVVPVLDVAVAVVIDVVEVTVAVAVTDVAVAVVTVDAVTVVTVTEEAVRVEVVEVVVVAVVVVMSSHRLAVATVCANSGDRKTPASGTWAARLWLVASCSICSVSMASGGPRARPMTRDPVACSLVMRLSSCEAGSGLA